MGLTSSVFRVGGTFGVQESELRGWDPEICCADLGVAGLFYL